MKRKKSSTIVYLLFFFVVFLAFCAFAVDATYVYTVRSKLQNATEAAALAGAAGFDPAFTAIDLGVIATVKTKADSTFAAFIPDNLETATAVIDVGSIRQVRVTSKIIAMPFFLSFLGVSGIRLNATAVAINEQLPVKATYTYINWVTAAKAYMSDIISADSGANHYRDTAILPPIGNLYSTSVDTTSAAPKFGRMNLEYLNKGDNKALSLGPGGYITIKLPAPIIDKPGNDLFIKEIGHSLEGYLVFAGLDLDLANPTVDGISWTNISCKGTPEVVDGNGGVGAYSVNIPFLGSQPKFYGSASFDIGATCSDGTAGIAMVKYLKIVDDNDESAFVQNTTGISDNKFYKSYMYGEASTPTSGADIDYVEVLNHVRLVPPSQWTP